MNPIHENDVVLAFRQSVEEELQRLQNENAVTEPVLLPGASTEDNLQRLAHAHAELETEVALLRTIILKLISDPVDGATP